MRLSPFNLQDRMAYRNSEIIAEQLRRLNVSWQHCCENVPLIRGLRETGKVPASFESLQHFQQSLPISTKEDWVNRLPEMIDPTQSADQTRATGGSTAKPVKFPVCQAECRRTGAAAWLGRSWVGVSPRDRLFLLWGHSHLFGTGVRGWLNRQRRLISDSIIGYHRFSAYDLSDSALRIAADQLLKFRPDWCLGYSVAWDRFATANADRMNELQSLKLKLIVATAEGFPHADSRHRLEKLFGCPVLMEYGTVETGVLAHETKPGHFRVLWQNHLLESIASADQGRHDIVVTSLYPRCVPLIRYRIGDQFRETNASESVLEFSSIAGRCNDFLELPGGKRLHSELIAHVVRDLPGIRGYQAVQQEKAPVQLHLLSVDDLSNETKEIIRSRLAKLDVSLGKIQIQRVAKLQQSVSGKTPTIARLHVN
jgi:phenylacetate-CoA ligase